MPIALGTIVSAWDKPLPKMREWTKGSILNAANSLLCIFGMVGDLVSVLMSCDILSTPMRVE
jgi:hypothetical protein